MKSITLGTDTLTVEELEAVARRGAWVQIDAEARTRVGRSRALVEKWVREGRAVYGVTTGFGALCDVAITGDQNQLQQVFSNILMNAFQAMPGGGEVAITCRAEMRGADGGRPRRFAVIDIKDTGPGIAQADREKIFEPFYTTKEASKGTGLGLSIARDIARDHGGDIAVSGETGAGAVFTVILPAGGEA